MAPKQSPFQLFVKESSTKLHLSSLFRVSEFGSPILKSQLLNHPHDYTIFLRPALAKRWKDYITLRILGRLQLSQLSQLSLVSNIIV